MALSYVLARPTGEPIGELLDAKSRGMTRVLNGVHTASVALSLDDPMSQQLAPGLARLKVYRDPTAAELASDPTTTRILVFYGFLPPKSISDDPASASVSATFADPRWVFPFRYTLGTEVFAGSDQGDILWSLINTQNARFTGAGELWIRQGSTTTGTLRSLTLDRERMDTIFQDIAQALDGPDYDVSPWDGYEKDTPASRVMGNLQAYAKQGQLRPNARFLYLETGGGNVSNMPRTYEDIYTFATVIGQSATASNIPLSSAYGDPTSSLYGLFEDYASESSVADQTVLDKRVKGEVEAFKVPRSTVTIQDPTADAPQPLIDYDIGDTVYCTCHKGSAVWDDLAVRVHQIDIAVSAEGRLTTTLTTSEI